jgi:hypothetical protein
MKINKSIWVVTQILLMIIFLCIGTHSSQAQQSIEAHPHILVNQQDKSAILEKIRQQPWASKSFAAMKQKLAVYVNRHKQDPEWILSRYLMNRIPGKRYTNFVSDADGTQLIAYSGDAPYPTVRVAPHKRPPVSKDGYTYIQPTIEELVPYDTSMKMLLQVNSPDKRKEWTDPQTFVDNINERINALALDAAILYWLNGDTSHARFAADILSQWAKGAFHQNPIQGPCRTGFLSIQTLGDGSYEAMPLIYDFLYDYLRKNNYETNWYESVFEKIAHTMTFRGFWNNNWFAAQSPALVFSALALEDKNKRNYYLSFVTTRDTINGGCGHLSLPTVVKEWLTPDGHWKEPGGYHNYPVSSLLTAALALEKNNIPVFSQFPSLLEASYVMLKYSFPNLQAPSFGDTGPATQSPLSLEIGLLMAQKYQHPILPELAAAMQLLSKDKGYKREESDYLGLLCYLPTIPANKNTPAYSWPRSANLDFAKAYFQRNGTDKRTALMYVVQGATYNHNHANGMAVELFGSGTVMGPDPGNGLTYEDPMHVGYYSQWAAHNTVIAGGLSAPSPTFKGGGGAKKMGEISLSAMEPMPETTALSDNFQFTITRYVDITTSAKQERSLAIIKSAPNAGYYLDIYRSDHPFSNTYIYHNIGKELQMLDSTNGLINLKLDTIPISQKPYDPPGLRFINHTRSTGEYNHPLKALFSIAEGTKDTSNRYMQVLFPGAQYRTFFIGMAPPTKTVTSQYRNMATPTIVCHQVGEAWSRPFVAVYEPYAGKGNNQVLKVENITGSNSYGLSALTIDNKNGVRHFLFQSSQQDQMHEGAGWKFKGSFGAVLMEKGQVKELYLGSGKEIAFEGYAISSSSPQGSASVRISEGNLIIRCNQPTTVNVKNNRFNVPAGATYTIPIEVNQ